MPSSNDPAVTPHHPLLPESGDPHLTARALTNLSFAPPETRAPATEIGAIVEIRDLLERSPARAMALFDEGFRIYCECFPDPSERSSREFTLQFLKDPTLDWRMYLALDNDGTVVAGRNMSIMETIIDGTPVPFAWDEHIYVKTDPHYRRHGLGSCMIQEINASLIELGIGMIFAELNDPNLMTTEELLLDLQSGITPEARLRFWEKQNYQLLNAPYAQPALDGGFPIFYLQLCCHIIEPQLIPEVVGFTGNSLHRDAYLSMIRQFHATFVDDMQNDTTSNYLRRLIARGPTEIQLTNLSEARTFSQDRVDLSMDREQLPVVF